MHTPVESMKAPVSPETKFRGKLLTNQDQQSEGDLANLRPRQSLRDPPRQPKTEPLVPVNRVFRGLPPGKGVCEVVGRHRRKSSLATRSRCLGGIWTQAFESLSPSDCRQIGTTSVLTNSVRIEERIGRSPHQGWLLVIAYHEHESE